MRKPEGKLRKMLFGMRKPEGELRKLDMYMRELTADTADSVSVQQS